MDKASLELFLLKLTEFLNEPVLNSNYLDLSQLEYLTRPLLNKEMEDLSKLSGLAKAFELILEAIQKEQLDRIKIGLNELLKDYARKIDQDDDQVVLTHQYCTRIFLLMVRCQDLPLAYSKEVWDYLSDCLEPVGQLLLSERLTEACPVFWDYCAKLGNLASHHGLYTDRLQHSLRIWEWVANDLGQQNLARKAAAYRQHIEL